MMTFEQAINEVYKTYQSKHYYIEQIYTSDDEVVLCIIPEQNNFFHFPKDSVECDIFTDSTYPFNSIKKLFFRPLEIPLEPFLEVVDFDSAGWYSLYRKGKNFIVEVKFCTDLNYILFENDDTWKSPTFSAQHTNNILICLIKRC